MTPNDELGQRIRAFRKMRGLSLRALSARAGVSSSLLSQLENGKVNPSIGTIRRIAEGLGVGLADFFESGSTVPRLILRRADRPALATLAGSRKYALTRPPLHHLEVYAAELDPGASTGDEEYVHGDSQEILLILEGSVTCTLNAEPYELRKGDSIEYRSSVPHRVINNSEASAEILWITAPPTPDTEVPASSVQS